MQVFRSVVSGLSSALRPHLPNVDIQTTQIENIPVRIYKPKTNKAEKLPIMIFCIYTFFEVFESNFFI
jgi:hypothetical protein